MARAPAVLLAHSAPTPDRAPHAYADHIHGATDRAVANAGRLATYVADGAHDFVTVVRDGTTYHDLGKVDDDNQDALGQGRKGRMRWDHVDAGVAHLMQEGAEAAAWLVRAHHSPGLPALRAILQSDLPRLRGGRIGTDFEVTEELVARTDALLPYYLDLHRATVGRHKPTALPSAHGLEMRLALSCLVDGDHADSAGFETGRQSLPAPEPRWSERLESLKSWVAKLPAGDSPERHANRTDFFSACLNSEIDDRMVACEGPVGLGKTTSVTAWLLRTAINSRPPLRRLFIVAPYTNIISQTVDRLRKALVLDGENPKAVVAEHHHRADFASLDMRGIAAEWRAPIIVTTAVQFFETLASNRPAQLRKLHALPGSAVFLDEAHAALPTHLWRQNWRWLVTLAERYSCRIVFASGSLARFWELDAVVGDARRSLPELTPKALVERVLQSETRRIAYQSLGTIDGIDAFIKRVTTEPGPRLVILNTVQSAAVVARAMRERYREEGQVLHISTALSPHDRERMMTRVTAQLDRDYAFKNWTLVATSCVEAGVDFSFRTAFRERFSTASLIQVGGRVNRHGESDSEGGATVYDFMLEGESVVHHPEAKLPGAELGRLFDEGRLSGDIIDPAGLVSLAMRREARNRSGARAAELCSCEDQRDYPEVAKRGRVIDNDTRIVLVDAEIRDRLERRYDVPWIELMRHSVQMWPRKIEILALSPIRSRDDIYWMSHEYDSDFLGYMAGVLKLDAISRQGLAFL